MIDRERILQFTAANRIALSDDALDRFDRYAEALIEANQYVNLTAITDPLDVTDKHFADSLTVLAAASPSPCAKWIDVGTGAGFPGAVLLMARPDLAMTLLDGTNKKLCFIKETLDSIGLQAETVHARAEEAGQDALYREKFDYVTARAVANLRELTEYCLPFLRIGGTFIAMKSSQSEAELRDAESAIRLLGGKTESVKPCKLPNGDERALILIKKISQTPPKYPRPSAKIAKQPLK